MNSLSERVCFVLIEPSHPGNVGATARAMKTMGWSDLRLVAPRDPRAPRRAEAIAQASGAGDVLERARMFDDMRSAVAEATLTIGLSARTREFAPPRIELETMCTQAIEEASSACASIAFVFGTERIGLTNEQAQRCDRLAYIDAEAEYSSLNLSQAVQLVAYELRRAARLRGTALLDREQPDYARHEDVERLHDHLREACVAVDFIDPEHPKKLSERLRRLFARVRLETEEVQLLRGLCKQMIVKAQGRR